MPAGQAAGQAAVAGAAADQLGDGSADGVSAGAGWGGGCPAGGVVSDGVPARRPSGGGPDGDGTGDPGGESARGSDGDAAVPDGDAGAGPDGDAAGDPGETWTDNQWARGSMSSRTAFASTVSGIARIAPSGPITQVQKISDTNESVAVRPTTSPTTFGWMTDWMITLITQ